MTFGAFADMGWYQVSYTRAQRLPWGNGQGCSFVQSTCKNWPSNYFCSSPGLGGCTVDLRYRGVCNAFVAPYTLATQFQYFPDQPSLGGTRCVGAISDEVRRECKRLPLSLAFCRTKRVSRLLPRVLALK
jgi:hypothetical protein